MGNSASISFTVSSMSPTQLQIAVTGESGNVSSRYQLAIVNNTTSITYTNPNDLDGGAYDPPAAVYTVNLSDFVNGSTPFAYTLGDSCTLEGIAIDNNSQLSTTPFTASYFGPLCPILYYSTQADAVSAGLNYLAYSTNGYTVQTEGGFSNWKLASSSNGSSSQIGTYSAGATLNSDGMYYLYPAAPCFLEGSLIRCLIEGQEKDVPIEQLRKGDWVKTELDGYKPIALIGYSSFHHLAFEERIQNQLYLCSTEEFSELTSDLVLTGAHSILVPTLTDQQRHDTEKTMGNIYITGQKYRLMAHLHNRTRPYPIAGDYTVWHLALEHSDMYMNYGIYANGGLLVESTSIRFLRDLSNMTLL